MTRTIKQQEFCHKCGKKLTKLIKITEDGELAYQNSIFVCKNKNCSSHININKIKTWKKK